MDENQHVVLTKIISDFRFRKLPVRHFLAELIDLSNASFSNGKTSTMMELLQVENCRLWN